MIDVLVCCFCRSVPTVEEYVDLTLRIFGSPTRQSLGAHRDCLESRLAPGFTIELEALDD